MYLKTFFELVCILSSSKGKVEERREGKNPNKLEAEVRSDGEERAHGGFQLHTQELSPVGGLLSSSYRKRLHFHLAYLQD